MHPRTPVGEKFADGRVVAQRRQQLDLGFAHLQKGRRQPILLIARAVRELGPKKRRIELDRGLEVGDRNADVVKPHLPASLPHLLGKVAPPRRGRAGWERGGRRQSRQVGRSILVWPINTDTTLPQSSVPACPP